MYIKIPNKVLQINYIKKYSTYVNNDEFKKKLLPCAGLKLSVYSKSPARVNTFP